MVGEDVERRRPLEGRSDAALPHGQQADTLVRPPARPQNGRVAAELLTYRVTATVTAAINEDDGDIHLVLRDDLGSTMIAEAPEPCGVR